MNIIVVLATLLSVVSSTLALRYPDVKREAKYSDNYHGTQVRDPYRGLENSDSFPTRKFLKSQKRLADGFFSAVADRDEIQSALKELSRFTTFSTPLKKGSRYFYTEHFEDEAKTLIYVKEKGSDPRVLVDSSTLSRDGSATLGPYTVSENGAYIAYSYSTKAGSDWKTVRFTNVETGSELDDKLQHTKNPALAWSHDNEGVFYTRYPLDREGNPSHVNNKVYYHKLTTSQYEDTLVAEFPTHPMWILDVQASVDGKYVIVSASQSSRANAIYIAALDEHPHRMNIQKGLVPIFSAVDGSKYEYVTNLDSQFLFLTDDDAPNGRLIVVDIGEEENANRIARRLDGDYPMSELLAEDSNKVLSWVRSVDSDYLVLCYLDDAKHTLGLISMTDTEKTATFPLNESSSVTQFTGGFKGNSEIFFKVESFITPGVVYKCDLKKGSFDCEIYRKTEATLDLSKFEMKQEFYDSKDGTPVPIYIVHKKDLKKSGTSPVLLHGDGGLNRNLLPRYSVDILAFVELFGGVYAVPNVRGGGEYGEQWHEEGSRMNKQNTFDDFQAAAQYLIKEKYTSSDKLAIRGSLNGGLLVATCINQRPDLFGAAIIEDGLLDMLRFQKFTGGYSWCAEYGCSDNKDDFKYLYKYSPLHNIQFPAAPKAQYPAVMVISDETDDRVVPAHSYKYIAELQNHIGRNKKQTRPLILRLDPKAGTGFDSQPREFDILSFLADTLSLEYRGVTILQVEDEEIEEDTDTVSTTMTSIIEG